MLSPAVMLLTQVTVVSAVIHLASATHPRLLPGSANRLPAAESSSPVVSGVPVGVYFGWARPGASRLHLLGAPCGANDPLQVAEIGGGDVRQARRVGADAVVSYAAALDQGRELLVTAVDVLQLGTRGPTAFASTPNELTFTKLNARCRSWREPHADLGLAGVRLLPGALAAEKTPPLEAHVLPLPDRSGVLALILLWNRSAKALEVSCVRYAPFNAATNRVLAVSGTFEGYDDLLAGVLGSEPGAAPVPTTQDAADLDLQLVPGGIALIAITSDSLRRIGGSAVELVLLSYPVIEYLAPRSPASASASASAGPTSSRALHHLVMETPLFARWSPE